MVMYTIITNFIYDFRPVTTVKTAPSAAPLQFHLKVGFTSQTFNLLAVAFKPSVLVVYGNFQIVYKLFRPQRLSGFI
jgi:hypothetical protein